MITIKTTETTDLQLAWLAAQALGMHLDFEGHWCTEQNRVITTVMHAPGVPGRYAGSTEWNPAANWNQGGRILEVEGISTRFDSRRAIGWEAYIWTPSAYDLCESDSHSHTAFGATKLAAGLRCFVISKFGYTAEIPEDLT